MRLEFTKAVEPLLREGDNYTKCYSKQHIGRQNTKTEKKFNPGLALIGLSGTGPRRFELGTILS